MTAPESRSCAQEARLGVPRSPQIDPGHAPYFRLCVATARYVAVQPVDAMRSRAPQCAHRSGAASGEFGDATQSTGAITRCTGAVTQNTGVATHGSRTRDRSRPDATWGTRAATQGAGATIPGTAAEGGASAPFRPCNTILSLCASAARCVTGTLCCCSGALCGCSGAFCCITCFACCVAGSSRCGTGAARCESGASSRRTEEQPNGNGAACRGPCSRELCRASRNLGRRPAGADRTSGESRGGPRTEVPHRFISWDCLPDSPHPRPLSQPHSRPPGRGAPPPVGF